MQVKWAVLEVNTMFLTCESVADARATAGSLHKGVHLQGVSMGHNFCLVVHVPASWHSPWL